MSTMRERLGPYRLMGRLGEGGMGIVYEALDERLDRVVALKLVRAGVEPQGRERLWREARAAARISHPGVCRLFEVGEADGEVYLAMERLEGESLASRLARGPVDPAETIVIGVGILDALEAIHQGGLVHRDLKPSNVFLTAHGPRLLDFGLARPAVPGLGDQTAQVTLPGLLLGTPHYMAPEVLSGEPADIRSDIFAVGALLHEMLAGRRPFEGETTVDLMHAILRDAAPALSGSDRVVAIDRVIHRALGKRREDRFQTPAEMAAALRAAAAVGTTGATATPARPLTRLIVLPFRMLRADPDLDFLTFSLADAVTTSLSGLESLVVRSSMTASRFAAGAADLQALAREADVDAVLAGTILAAGGQVRVSVQLVEAPSGTIAWSQSSQIGLGDLFQLQDTIVTRIVEALAIPLSGRERKQLHRDVPASATGYEYFLRANQLARDPTSWTLARDFYRQCLEADPNYAPAWARLGRCYRVIAKYNTGPEAEESLRLAEQAFERALTLNPDLSVAHNLYSFLELERGHVCQALDRLLRRAASRPADPELFVGLVQACRYGGLHDASLAADQAARRLDPRITTSVCHTYLALGDFTRAAETDDETPRYVGAIAMLLAGRPEESATLLRQTSGPGLSDHLRGVVGAVEAAILRQPAQALEFIDRMVAGKTFFDPEGWFYWAITLAAAGAPDRALDLLQRAMERGYANVTGLDLAPFAPLRDHPAFAKVVAQAKASRDEALAAYEAADGPRILG